MIRGYGDHAANERTFLAWIRTSIAVIAFGLVIERLDRLTGPLVRYDGLTLVLIGLVLIVLAAGRFIRTARQLDDPDIRSTGIRLEPILLAALALIVGGISLYLVLLN